MRVKRGAFVKMNDISVAAFSRPGFGFATVMRLGISEELSQGISFVRNGSTSSGRRVSGSLIESILFGIDNRPLQKPFCCPSCSASPFKSVAFCFPFANLTIASASISWISSTSLMKFLNPLGSAGPS